jgi:hypothetical protein
VCNAQQRWLRDGCSRRLAAVCKTFYADLMHHMSLLRWGLRSAHPSLLSLARDLQGGGQGGGGGWGGGGVVERGEWGWGAI